MDDDLELFREDRTNNPSPQQQRATLKKGKYSLSSTVEEGSNKPATKATYERESGRKYSGEYNPEDKSIELATEKNGKEYGINVAKDKVGAFAKYDFKKGGKIKAKAKPTASSRGDGCAQRGKTKGRYL